MTLSRLAPLLLLCVAACASTPPRVANNDEEPPPREGLTRVKVIKGEIPPEEKAHMNDAPPIGATDVVPATALTPPATPVIGASMALHGGTPAEGPLPLQTTLAPIKGGLLAIGRSRGVYVARAMVQKFGKPITWSAPIVVAPAFDDDAPPITGGDGDSAWFGVSAKNGTSTRIVRIDAYAGFSPKAVPTAQLPQKLGRIAAFVALKAHVAVIGRDGDAIMLARVARNGTFLDTGAKQIARGVASMHTTASRSPRATNEDDKILLAWDADDVSGALESPGTTPAEREKPLSGIYVQRFTPLGEPASPARRLTRPSFEAHALDVVVELGACAVLATTPDGHEMFRFVRKGNDLGPYGGGLHLAPAGGDVSLATDAIGTLAVTPSKLLRIGPGVKIVPSALGFSAPNGAAFDEVRVAPDGHGAHVVFSTAGASGPTPTIARIDGEHMGPILATPWIGPPPQRLVEAALDGDEGLALVVDGGALHAIRFGVDGTPRAATPIPLAAISPEGLAWPRAPVPRLARVGGEWIAALADGRVMVLTGTKAGSWIGVSRPKNGAVGGLLALMPNGGIGAVVRAVYLPPMDRSAPLWTTTLDPKSMTATPWIEVPGSEHNYGALGNARYGALPRSGGGLYLLTNSGPKVSVVAQLYDVVALGENGGVLGSALQPPGPVQEISLAPSTAGTSIVASITGRGVVAQFADAPKPIGSGWRESFGYAPFRAKGDGPIVRGEKGTFVLVPGTTPVLASPELVAIYERCPFVFGTGARSMLLVCEEGSSDSPLAARATTRSIKF